MTATKLLVATLAALLSSVAAAAGDETVFSAAVPDGRVIYERSSGEQKSWLVIRDLAGGRRLALTRRPTVGEQRQDFGAAWSPDGEWIAFARRTPKGHALAVVRADGSDLRRIVDGDDLRRATSLSPSQIRLSRPVWTADGSQVLFAVHGDSCSAIGVYRVSTDGSALRPVWRRPARLQATVEVHGTSTDGSRTLLTIDRNDGDCYYGHTGPATLALVRDGGSPIALATTSSFGGASWSPDGATIAYAAGCLDLCNLWSVRPAIRHPRRVTRFTTRTELLSGYDSVSFAWSGRSTELLYGRGRSLLSVDTSSGTVRRVATAPCLRPSRPCRLSSTSIVGSSRTGSIVVVDVYDVGCDYCEGWAPPDLLERYAVHLDDARLVRLVDPGFAVGDVFLP